MLKASFSISSSIFWSISCCLLSSESCFLTSSIRWQCPMAMHQRCPGKPTIPAWVQVCIGMLRAHVCQMALVNVICIFRMSMATALTRRRSLEVLAFLHLQFFGRGSSVGTASTSFFLGICNYMFWSLRELMSILFGIMMGCWFQRIIPKFHKGFQMSPDLARLRASAWFECGSVVWLHQVGTIQFHRTDGRAFPYWYLKGTTRSLVK